MVIPNSTATPPIRPARKVVETRKVYVFDAKGTLLGEHCSVTACAQKLGLGRPCISAGLQRGSMVASRYYISYDKEFKVANYNQAHNPLAERTHHPRGNRSKSGFVPQEFFDVIY
jgi:hypothetical protein